MYTINVVVKHYVTMYTKCKIYVQPRCKGKVSEEHVMKVTNIFINLSEILDKKITTLI